MRTEAELRQRVRGLLVQELDRRVAEIQKRIPRNCVYNYQHPLDTRKAAEGEINETFNRITNGRASPVSQTIGLCLLGSEDPQEWGGTICEDDIDAQRCPYFVPRQSKDEILAEFREQLLTPGWVDANLPAVAVLLWAIDETEVPSIPWWKRFWYRYVLRIRVDPVLPSKATALLLERAPEGNDEGVGP